MNDFFKLITPYEGQNIALFITEAPQIGGARIKETGDIVLFQGKMAFNTMFYKDGNIYSKNGLVRHKNDHIEWIEIETNDNVDIDAFAAFLIDKEEAIEIDERQLKLILKIVEEKFIDKRTAELENRSQIRKTKLN